MLPPPNTQLGHGGSRSHEAVQVPEVRAADVSIPLPSEMCRQVCKGRRGETVDHWPLGKYGLSPREPGAAGRES